MKKEFYHNLSLAFSENKKRPDAFDPKNDRNITKYLIFGLDRSNKNAQTKMTHLSLHALLSQQH